MNNAQCMLACVAVVFFACGTDISLDSGNEDGTTGPELAAIVANPITVMPGDTSVVTIEIVNGDLDTLTVAYDATGGTIEGNDGQATFTASSSEGVAWITSRVSDRRGVVLSTGSASINIRREFPLVSVGVQVLDSRSSENQCMVIHAVPAEPLFFIRIRVENPIAQVFEIPGDPLNALQPHETFPLQTPGQCFSLHSGAYNFTFTLRRTIDGASFSFDTTHNQP